MEEDSKRSLSPSNPLLAGVVGSAGQLLGRISRLVARVADARLRPLGLAGGQLPIFAALADGSEMAQMTLARLALIEQPTMAATLGRMERDGLIARRPDPRDKRSSLIRLTPAALERSSRVLETLLAAREEMLAGFDPAERDQLVAFLRRIVINLEAADARPDAPGVAGADGG